MVLAVLRHLFKNEHKVYVTCLWPDGQFLAEEALDQVAAEEYGLSYGEDYVLLGFRPGNEAVVKGIVSNLRKLYTIDARGTKVTEIPMMEGINRFEDFDFLFSASAGYPGTIEWVQYAVDPTDVPMSTGTTSIQVNEIALGAILPPSDTKVNDYNKSSISFGPSKRMGKLNEITNVIDMLINNDYITGETINIDGGRHLT